MVKEVINEALSLLRKKFGVEEKDIEIIVYHNNIFLILLTNLENKQLHTINLISTGQKVITITDLVMDKAINKLNNLIINPLKKGKIIKGQEYAKRLRLRISKREERSLKGD